MHEKKFLEVFDTLPTKRKKVLLGLLRGDSSQKIMCDAGIRSEGTLAQHKRQLYKNFKIEVIQHELDDPRSGERKLPQLIALCAKYKPDLVAPSSSLAFNHPDSHPKQAERTGDSIAHSESPLIAKTDSVAVYEPEIWVERLESQELLNILNSPCRILAISGMTGIGKTALMERLICDDRPLENRDLPLQDKQFCPLNLENERIKPNFFSGGAALLRALGEDITVEDQKDARYLLDRLVNLLKDNPYRLLINSLEHLLKGNEEEGWSNFLDRHWEDFFGRILAETSFQSQIVLTTQEIPAELEALGSRYPALWHSRILEGLNENQQLQLFEKVGLKDEGGFLARIGKLYAGHPLILRVIAEDIKAEGGNVSRYWQKNKFDALEGNHPVRLSTHTLRAKVRERVKTCLQRLPDDARQLLYRASVFRRPVPESFWLALLPELPDRQRENALALLKSRSLAELDLQSNTWLDYENEYFLKRQHHLIRNVANELLRKDETAWKNSEQKAAELWYQLAKDIENIVNNIKGYLEAFYHYRNAGDWKRANEICLKILRNEQYFFLFELEYVRELIKICNVVIKNSLNLLDGLGKFSIFNSLGNTFADLEQYEQSERNYLKALDYLDGWEEKDRYLYYLNKAEVLGNLGSIYRSQGKLRLAMDHYREQLDLLEEIKKEPFVQSDLYLLNLQISDALCSLGACYRDLGEYETALEYFHNELAILDSLTQKTEQISNHRKDWLVFYRLMKFHHFKATALYNIAEIYQKNDQSQLAKENCESALKIARNLKFSLVKECENLLLTIEGQIQQENE